MLNVTLKAFPPIPTTGYVASFFKVRGQNIDALGIFTSEDSLNWRTFKVPAWNGENGILGHDFALFFHGGYWFAPYTKAAYSPPSLGHEANFGLLRSSDLREWHNWSNISTEVAGLDILWSWAPTHLIQFNGAPLLTCSLTDSEINEGTYPGPLSTYYFSPTSADLSTWGPATRLTGTLGFGNEFDNHFFQFQDGTTYGRVLGNGLQIYLATSSGPTSGYTIQNQILPGGIARVGEGFTTFWLGEDHLGMIYKDYTLGALVFTDSEDNGVTWSAVQAIPSLTDYDHGGVWKL